MDTTTASLATQLLSSAGSEVLLLSSLQALVAHTGGEGVFAERTAAIQSEGATNESRCAAALAAGVAEPTLAVLSTHPLSLPLCTAACTLLRNLSSGAPDSSLASAAASAVTATLTRHSASLALSSFAWSCLNNFCRTAPGKAACQAAGCIPALVGALQLPLPPSIAAGVCGTLRALARKGEDALASCSATAPALVAALRAHPTEPRLAEDACYVLRYIAYSAAGTEACLAAGAVQAALAVLQAQASNPPAASQAGLLLSRLALHSAPTKAECLGAGLLPALVALLQQHPGDTDVVDPVCRALAALEEEAACIEAGAPEALMVALVEATDAQDTVCWAVHDIAESEQGAAAFLEAGAATALTALLLRLQASSLALEDCCKALGMLGELGGMEGERACAEAGAIPALVAVLGMQWEGTEEGQQDDALDAACSALTSLSTTLSSSRQLCVEAGGVTALLAVLARSPAVPDVQSSACCALGRAADCEQGRAACLQSGAAGALVAVLGAPSCTARTAKYACYPLSVLALDEGCKEASLAAGAVPAALAALRAHSSENAEFAKAACMLLGILAFDNTSGKQACLAAGAVDTLLTVLQQHPGVHKVQGAACQALGMIATSAAGKGACVAAGALPLLLGLLQKHPEDSEGEDEDSEDSEDSDSEEQATLQAATAFQNIVWRSPEHCAAALSAGALGTLEGALEYSPWHSVREVVESALDKMGYDTVAGVQVVKREDYRQGGGRY